MHHFCIYGILGFPGPLWIRHCVGLFYTDSISVHKTKCKQVDNLYTVPKTVTVPCAVKI